MSTFKQSAKKTRSILNMQTHKHPKMFVIVMMVMINVVIVLLAALIAWLIDDSFQSYLDALINGSVIWLLTPNAVLGIENPATFWLAIIVLMVGLVLFSGTIIGLATNMIKDFFSKKEAHEGKFLLEDHIVILNYNNKVPELVADLVHVKSRAVNLVVLTPTPQAHAEQHILQAIKQTNLPHQTLHHLNVFVKSGEVLLEQNLRNIAIDRAQTIVVMGDDSKTMAESDLEVLKILLTLGNLNLPPKNIVTEVKLIDTKTNIMALKKTLETLKGHHIEPICFDRRLGQMMAQAVFYPAIEDVYLSLFSFAGSEAYRLENTTFETVIKAHAEAIPIMQAGEDVFVYTATNQSKTVTSPHTFEPKALPFLSDDARVLPTVFILGENRKLPHMLEAFKAYEALHQKTLHIETWSYERLFKAFDTLEQTQGPVTVLLLSNDQVAKDLYDGDVLGALIFLEHHLKREDKQIIVELLDPRNDALVKEFTIENTIISNKLVALMLSKVALFPKTTEFYDRLLTIEPSAPGKDDDALDLARAKDVLEGPYPWTFESQKQWVESCYLSTHKTRIPIGLIRDETLIMMEHTLHHATPYTVYEEDMIVWFKV